MNRNAYVIVVAGLALFGCASDGGVAPNPRTQVEMRHFQTRSYPTDDARLVMKAMVNVLQDLGFMIKNADADLGLVTAEKWANVEYSEKETKRARKKGTTLPASVVTACTANVSEFGKECRVRLTFQERSMGPAGAVIEAHVVDDAAFYQAFFAKVDKGVFLQREGI